MFERIINDNEDLATDYWRFRAAGADLAFDIWLTIDALRTDAKERLAENRAAIRQRVARMRARPHRGEDR